MAEMRTFLVLIVLIPHSQFAINMETEDFRTHTYTYTTNELL